ncbi:MAG: hypothetical protein LUC85_00540 [Bacteroidales bacterium]|nr:hypothetical protein [Bacteroidales bacterium]
MKIQFYPHGEITTFEDWKKLFTQKDAKNWKEGRSAWSLANFIMRQDGVEKLAQAISPIIGEKIAFDHAIVEHVISFDEYQRGSHRDLSLTGTTSSGKTVFVTVEAKVDEPFDITIREYYASGSKDGSKQRPRLEGLCQRVLHRSYGNVGNKELRYQLLHATAATVDGAPEADYHLMVVLAFENGQSDPVKMAANKENFLQFLAEFPAKMEKNNAVTADVQLRGSDKTVPVALVYLKVKDGEVNLK